MLLLLVNVIGRIFHQAGVRPRQTAVLHGGTGIDYAGLGERVLQRAEMYPAPPAGRTLRWGLTGPEGPDWLVESLAVIHAGHCLVPVSPDYHGPALDAFIRSAGLAGITHPGNGDYQRRPLPLVDPASAQVPEDEFHAMAPAFLRFSSGTTGRRKGVVLGHDTISRRIDDANTALQIGPTDRVLWLMPMAHHYVVSILLYLVHGATILIPRRGEEDSLAEMAARATVMYADPAHYRDLCGVMEKRGSAGTALRLAISTATGLDAEAAARFLAATGVPLTQAYGVIEAGLPAVNLATASAKPAAIGRPVGACRLTLVDESGKPVDGRITGHPAELHIHAPGLFDAYLNPWTPARALAGPHGFATGDLARVDADGDYFIVGRRANRIERGGQKFFCEEVEAALNRHPAIRESRVLWDGAAGELRAELVLVDPVRPPSTDDLRAFAGLYLQDLEIPDRFDSVERLPKTPTGKIQRW